MLEKILKLLLILALLSTSACKLGGGEGGSGDFFGGGNPDQAYLDRIVDEILEDTLQSLSKKSNISCDTETLCAEHGDNEVCRQRPRLNDNQEFECSQFLNENIGSLLNLVRSKRVPVIPHYGKLLNGVQPVAALAPILKKIPDADKPHPPIKAAIDLINERRSSDAAVAGFLAHEFIHTLPNPSLSDNLDVLYIDDDTSLKYFSDAIAMLRSVTIVVTMEARRVLMRRLPPLVLLSDGAGNSAAYYAKTGKLAAGHSFQDPDFDQSGPGAGDFSQSYWLATGDINGDFVPDYAASDWESRTIVLIDGKTGAVFHEKTNGNIRKKSPIAIADVDGDNFADLIVGTGEGEAKIFVYSGRRLGRVLYEVSPPYHGYNKDIRVAAADLNGDGKAEVISSPGIEGGPHVAVFDFQRSGNPFWYDFAAYEWGFRGGVHVAAGDLDGDGKAEIITSPDTTGSSMIKVFNGTNGVELRHFWSHHISFEGGVTVATGDVDGNGKDDIIVAPKRGQNLPIRVFDNFNKILAEFVPQISSNPDRARVVGFGR